MLRLFERLLGPHFWKHVVIVFTHVDEDQRDYLEQNIDALTDPAEGFVRVLSQWFNLPYQPPLVFLSNKDTRYSQYARDCFMELYEAVVSVEEGTRSAKFTCTFFQEVNNRVRPHWRRQGLYRTLYHGKKEITVLSLCELHVHCGHTVFLCEPDRSVLHKTTSLCRASSRQRFPSLRWCNLAHATLSMPVVSCNTPSRREKKSKKGQRSRYFASQGLAPHTYSILVQKKIQHTSDHVVFIWCEKSAVDQVKAWRRFRVDQEQSVSLSDQLGAIWWLLRRR